MIEGPCDCHPWSRIAPLCSRCGDTRRISSSRDSFDSVTCPKCGTDAARDEMASQRLRDTLPRLKPDQLTPEEREVFMGWRARAFHELDCLRWIEGRRYDPGNDPSFLADCNKALLKAAFIHEQPEYSFCVHYKAVKDTE